MSSHFQNRLVGIIVIVSLGVIFLPDLLGGKNVYQQEEFAEIPLRPQINPEHIAPDAEPASVISSTQSQNAVPGSEDKWTISDKAAADTIELTTATVKDKASVSNSKPAAAPSKAAAWTLQLGSFNNANNVNTLVKRLRAKGFDAYTLPQTPVEGQLTKVFVGPNLSKDKLQTVRESIEKLTDLKGRIIPFNPTDV